MVFLFLDGPPTAGAISWIWVSMGNSKVKHTSRHCPGSYIVPYIHQRLPQSLLNKCALFADDTTTYGVGKLSKTICSSLSSDMDSAADWAKTWRMLINAEMSEHLSIKQSSSSPSSSDSHVIMGGIQIPKVTEHKHLGITIQSSLKWSRQICNVYTACAHRVGILRRLKRKLQPSTILKIYTGTVRPIMEYACAIWSGGPTARKSCSTHSAEVTV